MTMEVTFEDLVTSPQSILGARGEYLAQWKRFIGFPASGDVESKGEAYFNRARKVAEEAAMRPFLISIGAGRECPKDIKGRVLNVSKVGLTYGLTDEMLADETQRERMARWPIATELLDVYEVVGTPHLIDDLGLPDKRILDRAFDRVIGFEERPEKIIELWEALRGYKLQLLDLPPLGNHAEPIKPAQYSRGAIAAITAEEGKRIAREVRVVERSSELAREARKWNRELNGGSLVCEGCSFSDEMDGMFDVHHVVPLMVGVRATTLSDLAVLCPLCHRWVHRKGNGQTDPLPLAALKAARNEKTTN